MDNDNLFDNENALHLYMEPSTLGEALEDYFKKIEIIPEDARLDKVQIPIYVDEQGTIPVAVTLKDNNNKRLN